MRPPQTSQRRFDVPATSAQARRQRRPSPRRHRSANASRSVSSPSPVTALTASSPADGFSRSHLVATPKTGGRSCAAGLRPPAAQVRRPADTAAPSPPVPPVHGRAPAPDFDLAFPVHVRSRQPGVSTSSTAAPPRSQPLDEVVARRPRFRADQGRCAAERVEQTALAGVRLTRQHHAKRPIRRRRGRRAALPPASAGPGLASACAAGRRGPQTECPHRRSPGRPPRRPAGSAGRRAAPATDGARPPASWTSARFSSPSSPASMTACTASARVRSSLPARNARSVNSPGPAARAPDRSSVAVKRSSSGGQESTWISTTSWPVQVFGADKR